MLTMSVGDIWLFDTTKIHSEHNQHLAEYQHWLILDISSTTRPGYDGSYSVHIRYLNMANGTVGDRYTVSKTEALDFTGNPYYKKVA
jgi:hypothetical protein